MQGVSFDRCQRVNCEASPLSAAIDWPQGERERGKEKRGENKKEIKEEEETQEEGECVRGEERR